MINEETATGDVQGFTKPLDNIDKRPTFKDFFKRYINKKDKKRKDVNVLQKQKDK
jgi:hypothetical protein